jgi:DNA-binding NtrC family response regulator
MALILTINEEKDSLTLIERILTREGHQVASFGTAREAVNWLQDHHPDLVLASGGRQGEKSRETLSLLNQTGFPMNKILLLLNPGVYVQDHKSLPLNGGQIISGTLDEEDLILLINRSI